MGVELGNMDRQLGAETSRLSRSFRRLASNREKALIVYLTAGDPASVDPAELIVALAEAGADAIEIGIPFSDPLADGPSIQASSQRALKNGMTVAGVLSLVQKVREKSDVPLIVMTYINPIMHFGLPKYAREAAQAGVYAHIVTDLTPEESEEWLAISREQKLDTIFLLAPTSTDKRIRIVSNLSTGFIYCVSRTGVTGARSDLPTELPDLVSKIRSAADKPICIGFGISKPEHVAAICRYADGVVIGSALVNLLHENDGNPAVVEKAQRFVAGLKGATRNG